MYVFVPYPSWRYHRTEKPRLVQNEAEDRALGAGWADTPTAFTTPPPQPAAEPVVKPPSKLKRRP